MTQEAMNKLSHLIRAKDCEIEALKTKSDSLMEILRNSEGTDQLTKLLDEADKDRAIIQGVKTEKQDIINAYNQLEHSVMVLKSDFETLEASYQQEIQRMNLAINSQDTQQGITEAHELEIATMKILVEKIRAKSKTGAVREAPDGSDFGGSNHKMSDNSFADKEMLTSSVRNLKERCSALEAKNTAMKRDNDALRDQLMDRREKWDVLEVTNKNLAHEVSNRDAKLSELKAKVTEYTDIIEQQKTIIKTLEKDTKEMARLKEHMMSTEQEFETEMNNRHESEARLQEQVDALRNGLHDASGHHKDLEDKQQGK
jgi:chromosome segregation ATPase